MRTRWQGGERRVLKQNDNIILAIYVFLWLIQKSLFSDFLFRQFLWSFRLPGEAQKIDRMMECFAERYCFLNPGMFVNTGEDFSINQ